MLSSILQRWRSTLQFKSFRYKILISGLLAGVCAFLAPIIFQFIQERKGPILNDYLLRWLPAHDLSILTFTVLYIFILAGVISLLQNPQLFLQTLQAYLILTIMRFISLLLVPLNPPLNIIELNDPLVQHFFYQQSITKDLFFSGHTSILVLLALAVTNNRLKIILFSGALVVALMLLVQHAHYTIDVVAAPLFSWMAFYLAKKIP
ncbi:MAG TPA: phosphatase PAP2-related protein [Cyclobacteriaceae bacterium]|nr:phosphatase PAP2-related protein [Cyclobacteriaceae bacterium]